ncbi:MAG: aminotransferase class V-fold PLP-dependent enzyme [Dermatophilaceae bacterium]
MPPPTPADTAVDPSPAGPRRALLDATPGPLHPAAREALLSALDNGWADPRRLHSEGRRAAHLLDQAREVLADAVGARPAEVSLHPSGSHALQGAITGLRSARRRVGDALVTTAVEQALVLRSPDTEPVGVDRHGRVEVTAWAEAIGAPGVAMGIVAPANPEIGTRQPVEELAAASRAAGVPLLVDATSTVGRLPLPRTEAYAVCVADAAAFGGPPLGLLAVGAGTRWRPPGPVSAPERGREVAPPSVPLALAAAEAWRQHRHAATDDARVAHGLIAAIRAAAADVPDVEVVGDPDARLPHVVTFSCLYVDGEALVGELDRRGFAVASGSACTADTLQPSHVLAAIGALTHGNVRVTLPLAAVAPTRERDVARFCAELPQAVAAVRAHLGTLDL